MSPRLVGAALVTVAIVVITSMIASAVQRPAVSTLRPPSMSSEAKLPDEDERLLHDLRAPPSPEQPSRLPVAAMAPVADPKLHQEHAAMKATAVAPRRRIDPESLADFLVADRSGKVILSWDALATATINDDSSAAFPAALAAVDGKQVTLAGFMAPLDEVGQVSLFLLLEFPAGCFYCQTPEPTGIVLVSLADRVRSPILPQLVKVAGRLRLNRDDPEDFLFHLSDAEVSAAD